jgi:hypothetical protein
MAYTRRFLYRASDPDNNPTEPRTSKQPQAAKATSSSAPPSPFDDADEYIKLVSTQDSPMYFIPILTDISSVA